MRSAVWVLLGALSVAGGACADDAAQPGGAADTGGGAPVDIGGGGGGGDVAERGEELTASIDGPADGDVFRVGDPVPLAGRFAGGGGALSLLDASISSSLDGVVWQGHPSPGGAVEATLVGLRSGLHDLTLRATASSGHVAAASVRVRVNAPPGTPVVSIDPLAPGTDDDLVAVITEPATDADLADTVGYAYAWSRDGVGVPDATGKTVTKDRTARGEVWEVRVVASDGWHPGEGAVATVTIANSAPKAGGALVLPSSGTTASTLTCSVTALVDADGDAVEVTFEWLVNGQPAGEGSSLDGSHFSKGDAVVCRATPSDGSDAGEPVESAPVPILNSTPTIDGVALSPEEGLATTAFTCTWGDVADADGDQTSAQIVWVLDGEELAGTTSQTIVPAAVGAVKGQALRCRIKPSDGQGVGTPVDSNLVVLGNAKPVVASVIIQGGSGGEASEGDELSCESSPPEDGDGDAVGLTWGWLVDGEAVVGPDGGPVQTATLGGAHFDKGQVVQCTATPHDGEDAGATVTSKNALTIVDTAPTLGAVELAPKVATRTTELTCTATGFADPDPADSPGAWGTPDPDDASTPGVAIQWLAGGAPIGGATAATFVPSSLAPGDVVSCRATPHDGQLAGPPVTSAPVTLANVKPQIQAVALGPDPAFGDSVLVCAPDGWSDPDGDPEGYQWAWTKNGQPLELATGPTLDGTHFGKGDTLLCTATPTDGWDTGGAVASNQLTIQNQPPSLAGASLTPAAGGKKDTFTCVPDGHADADALDPVYYSYAWRTAAGQDLALAGPKVSGAELPFGVQVVCEVTPFDGEAYGEPAVSNPATVINNAPTLAGAVIEPTAPSAGDTLTCTAVGFADPDGDAAILTYQWFVNAQPLVGQAASTLAGGTLVKGQKVFCRITPGDGIATGTPKTSTEVTIGNAPPSAPLVQVTPVAPEAGQALSCTVIGGAEDPDGDIPTVTFAWLLDGALVPGVTGPTVDGALTTQCGQWTCSAVATDSDGGESAPGTDTVSLAAGVGVVFAGAGQRVVSGPAPGLVIPGGSVTVEAWVRRTGDGGVVVSRESGGKGYRLLVADGVPMGVISDGAKVWSVAATDGLPLGLYTHLAMTYDGGVLRLFVGGALQPAPLTIVGVGFEDGGALVLGDDTTSSSPFAGALDEVRVSSTARYATSFTPKVAHAVDPSTIAYYTFEADGPAIAYDKSGKGNDGVLFGATHGPGICNPSNQAPSPPTVELQPVAPGAGAPLTCAVVTPSVDPDGDAVSYLYTWFQDGAVRTDLTTATVAAGQTAACEAWACEVIATDGVAESAPATASAQVQDASVTTWYGYDGTGGESAFDQLGVKEEVAVVFPKVPGPVSVTAIYVKMDALSGAQAMVYAVTNAAQLAAPLWQGPVTPGVGGFQKLEVNGGAGVVVPDGSSLRVGVRCASDYGLTAYYRSKGFGTHLVYACNAYFPGLGCLGSYAWTGAGTYIAGYWEIHADVQLPGGGICQ